MQALVRGIEQPCPNRYRSITASRLRAPGPGRDYLVSGCGTVSHLLNVY